MRRQSKARRRTAQKLLREAAALILIADKLTKEDAPADEVRIARSEAATKQRESRALAPRLDMTPTFHRRADSQLNSKALAKRNRWRLRGCPSV